jgi:dolichyl-phosphate beta-glucosyltransferase
MISIVIAAYNEEKRISPSLFKIKEYLTGQDMDYEIIVVDDGSTDHTRKIATDLIPDIPHLKVISYETNRGKGYALKTGVLASDGYVVLLTEYWRCPSGGSTPLNLK